MSAICSDCGREFDESCERCPRCGSGNRKLDVRDSLHLFEGLDAQKFSPSGSLTMDVSSHENALRKGCCTVDWGSHASGIAIEGELRRPLEKARDELKAAEALARALNLRDGRVYVAYSEPHDPPDAWLEDRELPICDPVRWTPLSRPKSCHPSLHW